MRPPSAPFEGPLITDLAAWGGAASGVGYASGFAYGWVRGPLEPRDLVWMGGVGTGILLCLVLPTIMIGHLVNLLGLP